jgi:hypothetical protein
MGAEPLPGNDALEVSGFSYLPRFITPHESDELLRYFGSLKPLWESRYVGEDSVRQGATANHAAVEAPRSRPGQPCLRSSTRQTESRAR